MKNYCIKIANENGHHVSVVYMSAPDEATCLSEVQEFYRTNGGKDPLGFRGSLPEHRINIAEVASLPYDDQAQKRFLEKVNDAYEALPPADQRLLSDEVRKALRNWSEMFSQQSQVPRLDRIEIL